jgi:hypothetical protein
MLMRVFHCLFGARGVFNRPAHRLAGLICLYILLILALAVHPPDS